MPAAWMKKILRRGGKFLPGILLTAVIAALAAWPVPGLPSIEPLLHDMLLWRGRPESSAMPDSSAAAAAATTTPQITVIEIDDLALENFGRWPWQWRHVADVIESLAELDARLVALDITYGHQPDPVLPPGTAAGQLATAEDQVQPLAAALAAPQKTVLTYPVAANAGQGADARRRLERKLALLCDREGLSPPQARDQVAAQLAADQPADEQSQLALLKLADQWLQRRDALMQLGLVPVDGAIPRHLPLIERVDPPLVALQRAASGSGFANAQPDADGTIRRIPLVMALDRDRLLPQLALEIAMQAIGWDDYRLSWHNGGRTLRISSPTAARSIDVPLDDCGNLVINWSPLHDETDDKARAAAAPIRRLSVRKLREYALLRQYDQLYDRTMNQFAVHWIDLGRQRSLWLSARALSLPAGPIYRMAMESQIIMVEEKLAMEALTLVSRPRRDDIAQPLYDQIAQGVAFIIDHQENAHSYRRRLARLAAELRPLVTDRVCIIGMTATSLAPDLKPTPIHPMLPGVYAHANIVSNLLRGNFVRQPTRGEIALMTVAVGLAVTLLAGALGGVRSLMAAIVAMVAYYLIALTIFSRFSLLMPLSAPWTAALASLIGVTSWRELTEGRRRRWITGVFKRYTSDQLVDALVENPADLVLGGQRRVMTVYFSDIAGFTGISERLDPATLVSFLQTYLEIATDRLLEQGGTLDKYQGDGIVAFFGAPLPLADHAARCLRAAHAHLRALPQLNRQLRDLGLLPDNLDLRVRIGISTGSMIVGNIGSARRFEYTVIGDAVNIGSRIEGANRFFGTTVLLSDDTRRQALETAGEDEFLLRRIGPVRFVGKNEPVIIHQLLDKDEPDAARGLDIYDEGVALFEQGRDQQAREKFMRLLDVRPGDGPALAHLQRIARRLAEGKTAPPGPWIMDEK